MAQQQATNERSLRSVFVGNIPYDTSEEKLKEIFSEAGPVISFKLVYDRESGKPKGYGFCEYRDQETALSAMRNLNSYEINGRNLRVDTATNERFKEEIKNLQMSLSGSTFESPYGLEVEPDKAPEQIAKVVSSLPPEQMYEIAKQMKHCVLTNPNEARNMLLQNPQLAYALLQLLVVMRAIDLPTASSILYKPNPPPMPIPPGATMPPQQQPQQHIILPMTQQPQQQQPPMIHPNLFDPSIVQQPIVTAPIVPSQPIAQNPFDPRLDPRLRQQQVPPPTDLFDPRIIQQQQQQQPPPVPTQQTVQSLDPRLRVQIPTVASATLQQNTRLAPQQQQSVGTTIRPTTTNLFNQQLSSSTSTTTPSAATTSTVATVSATNNIPSTLPTTTSTAASATTSTTMNQSEQEKAQLIMQVLSLSDQQINMLPADQRQSILMLRQQLQQQNK